MINVNQITAQLARMPDQALQQYASLHKGDPYTVALALSESNRRKQIRTASQMSQGEMPKVVDQQVAEMAPPQPAQAMPEDVGIGALPAGNMDFAEGGIVAFADGGVPGYAAGGAPVRSTSGGREWFLDVPETVRDPSVPYYRLAPNPIAALAGQRFASREEAEQAYNAATAPTPAQAAPVQTEPAFTRPAMANDPRMAPGFQIPTAAAPRAQPADTGGIAQLQPAASPRATGAAPAQDKDYMTLLREAEERAGPAVDPLEERRKAASDKAIAAEKDALGRRQAEIEEEDKTLFKGREDRIAKKEAALGKETGKVEGLALLEAGLAMMQSTGRGLAGIAQGAGVGLKAYSAGIDKIKSAQEKLDEARDRMEDLRQNRTDMNRKEVRDAEKGIRQLGVQGERDMLDGLSQATGEQKKDVRASVTSALAMSESAKDRASRLEAANIAAAPGMARVKLAKDAQGDTAKVRSEYGKLQTKVMSDLAKDPNYMMATDAQKSVMATTRLREALNNNPFLAQYAANIGFSGGATGTVRELDEVE